MLSDRQVGLRNGVSMPLVGYGVLRCDIQHDSQAREPESVWPSDLRFRLVGRGHGEAGRAESKQAVRGRSSASSSIPMWWKSAVNLSPPFPRDLPYAFQRL